MRNPRAEEDPAGAQPAGGGYWFTPLPVYLVESTFDPASPINAPAAMLWAHIHRHYAWRRRVFPSYATLAEETGQSESAVKRQMAALRQAGALTWGATYGAKGRSSNEYALAPMRPFDFDRATAPAVQVKSELHPPVEVKNDLGVEVKSDPNPQVKNDLGVKSTVELESTSSSRVPKPRAVPDQTSGPEEEGSSASPELNRARLLLMTLPAPWTCGPKDADRIAPQLAEAASRLGWQLDERLAAQIATNPVGINNYPAVIAKDRIPNLRPYEAVHGRRSNLPPACPACLDQNPHAEHNARFRTHNGHTTGRPCTTCHPDSLAAAA